MIVFGSVCVKTGVPTSSGYLIDKYTFVNRNDADKYCKNKYKKTYAQLRDLVSDEFNTTNCLFCNFKNWTPEDIFKQGFFYTQNGDLYYLSDEP